MNAIARTIQTVPFIRRLVTPAAPEILVTEGISGLWHYHLSTRTQRAQGLSGCGARVMSTGMELADWGKPFGAHFPKRPTFCAQCALQHADGIAAATGEPSPAARK